MERSRHIALRAVTVALLLYFCSSFAAATNYDYYPGNPANFAQDLYDKILQGGDVVTFHAASGQTEATYDLAGFGSTFHWVGSQNNPIIIRANPAHTIKLTQSVSNKNIIQMNGEYFVFEGFEIEATSGATGGIGLRLMKDTNHVVLQDLKVHDLYENAVTANDDQNAIYTNLTFRRMEIWNTAGTGECIYVGCQGTGTTTPCSVRNSLFENNYCHDTCLGWDSTECRTGSRGSGFQIKFGSYGNIIRNNVCKDTQGVCVLLYDDWNLGANLVEGNVAIGVKDDHGIQVTAGAVIRNNIVINAAGDGINLSNNANNVYNNLGTRRVTMEHNTVVNNAGWGIRYYEVPSDSHFINNVAIGNSAGAYRDNGIDMTGVDWKRNAYDSGEIPQTAVNGTFQVGNINNEFIDAAAFNLYPKTGGSLAGAGYEGLLRYDFNGRLRTCVPTVGAYEKTATNNPGWTITGSIKPIDAQSQPPCARDAACTLSGCSGDSPTSGGAPTSQTPVDETPVVGTPLDDSQVPAPTGASSYLAPALIASTVCMLLVAMLA